jgi:thiamine-phosphate pyrophosphorylase
MAQAHVTQLYLITPPRIDDVAAFARLLADTLAAGEVACVQLRLKDLPDEAILAAGRILGPIVQSSGAAFVVNDRPDLADALKADGVHIGQEDAPYAAARKIMGKDRIVGVTCHDSRHLAMDAAERGADYIAFGAFHETATKQPKSRANPELLGWWQEVMEVPCVAIGGITLQNGLALAQAGADFLAVSSGVWNHPEGPQAAVAGFSRLLAQP